MLIDVLQSSQSLGGPEQNRLAVKYCVSWQSGVCLGGLWTTDSLLSEWGLVVERDHGCGSVEGIQHSKRRIPGEVPGGGRLSKNSKDDAYRWAWAAYVEVRAE